MFVAKMSDDPFLCSGKPASQTTLEERTRTGAWAAKISSLKEMEMFRQKKQPSAGCSCLEAILCISPPEGGPCGGGGGGEAAQYLPHLHTVRMGAATVSEEFLESRSWQFQTILWRTRSCSPVLISVTPGALSCFDSSFPSHKYVIWVLV